MAISRCWSGVPRAGSGRFQFFGAGDWVRRLHSLRLEAIGASPQPEREDAQQQADAQAGAQAARQQQRVIDRLLATDTDRPFASYKSLPALFEAPDLLENPRLASLVTAIDSRLLAPLYRDVDHHNGRLKFFLTGDEHKPASSFFVRSFMPHFRQNNLFYLNRNGLERKDTDGLPWQPLVTLMTDVFASIGVTELRDVYTHVLPAGVGRHVVHRDRLQSGTWKVDIRWSPNWTELLFLDTEDSRWYALRFPPGGSGFIIDSVLFRRFHAVRAGPAIQQSVLLVFHQQGSTMQMVREALAARVTMLPLPNRILPPGINAGTAGFTAASGAPVPPLNHGGGELSGSLAAFAFPVATEKHPRAMEALRVVKQSALNVRNSVQRLRAAVLAIEPRARSAWLKVPQQVIDQALATFPEQERDDLLQVFHASKGRQHVSFGMDRFTSIATSSRRESGRKKQRVIDDRHVSIQGTVSVEGKTLHFPMYDGTEATRLRFAWKRRGLRYSAPVSTTSANKLSVPLAALMASNKFILAASGTYSFDLDFDGDSIVGPAATRLRELGLTLQVVHVDGELDNQTKRARELRRVRVPVPERRTRPLFLASRKGPARNPWCYFLADRYKVARKSFDELTAEDRKAYEDKAEADKSRYQLELSALPQKLARPAHPFSMFISDHPGMDVKRGAPAWAQLSPQEKLVYKDKSNRHRTQRRDWRRSTGAEVRLKGPRHAYSYFLQEFLKASKPMYDHLSPEERKMYEDKAREGRERYEDQESQWSAQQSPTTAYEVFRAEISPALLQTVDSNKFSGRAGQRHLNRELRAQWKRLSRSDWTEYERKLQTQSEGASRNLELIQSASSR